MTPLNTLLNHLPALRDAYRDSPSHQVALDRFNAATGASLKHNTWKTIAPAIHATAERLDKECQTKLAALQVELDTVRQQRLNKTASNRLDNTVSNPPKTWHGWSVQTDKRGYTRLYRKVGGKLACVYVGKRWSEDTARAKLEAAGYTTDK